MNRTRTFPLRGFLITLLLFAAVFLAVFFGTGRLGGSVEAESAEAAKNAINRALKTCYAVEGSYPADIAYLEQNYGISIDHGKYLVDYRMFATNLMPEVRLIKRN